MTLSNPSAGHDPALPTVTRRSLLRASPALLAPCLLTAPGVGSTNTPILRLFREWDDLQVRWQGSPEKEEDWFFEENERLERAVAEEPSTCLADLAAKVIVSTCYGEFAAEPRVTAECEAILAGGAA